ncbi:DUF4386 domain-containing protein [Reichenbachiella versicolor]|uniref:DUF4386 domain-containing protein n=1 Tax=Reichenbachiella versicolor TaxID=1821036 RepID=UPI001C8890FD|nr:DUF4386 domain-containing protein [Reichenbachiella versicolor]
MNSNKKIGRYAGALFLFALIPYVIGQVGILESLLYVPNYLQKIIEVRLLIGVGILLKWISLTAMIAFAILVFPILRSFGNKLTIGYLSLRFIEFGMLILGSTKLLSLVSLSKQYMSCEESAHDYIEVEADTLLIEWEWIGFVYMFIFALHCFVFYYLMYKSNLVLRLISIFGLISSV